MAEQQTAERLWVDCKGCAEAIPLGVRTTAEDLAATQDDADASVRRSPETRRCPICSHEDVYEWAAVRFAVPGEAERFLEAMEVREADELIAQHERRARIDARVRAALEERADG